MVLEVGTNAGKVGDDVDVEALEEVSRADAA